MVNIGGKETTERYALAAGMVFLGPAAYELVKQNKIKKGDVLTVAQLAGAPAVSITCDPSQLWSAASAPQLLRCTPARSHIILLSSHLLPSRVSPLGGTACCPPTDVKPIWRLSLPAVTQ